MAAPSSLASSHLADLHRASGASPSPLPRRIHSSSASGALAAARSASSPWPDPASNTSKRCRPGSSVGAGLLGHGDGGEAVNGVIVRADQPRLAADGGVAGEEGRILPRPRSTSELVAGDRVLRRDLVTGGHVHRPCLSRWLRPPRRSSSPVPPPSPRRILRRPRPTPELIAGAVSVTTQDPPPSMRPCPTPELAGGRVLHAGARRRQPRLPRRSSAAATASAPPTSASSALLPWWPSFSRLREVDRERYRYIAAPLNYVAKIFLH
uniref:Uncharacterized protein n=1 Tax=Oryza meridionalis TaxID=40149 RepID=A0A0E0DVB1_9ORYZ